MNRSVAPHFDVQVACGECVRVSVRGEFDLAAAPVFEDSLRALEFSSVTRVVLDLDALEFIDASGVRAVLGLHARCSRASAELVITTGPRPVQRVFELTGTGWILAAHP